MNLSHLRPHEVDLILRHWDRGRLVIEIQRLSGRPQHVVQAVLAQHRDYTPGKGRGRRT